MKGYQLGLVQTPFQISPVQSVARTPEEHSKLEEIQRLLSKKAIEVVHPQIDQFVSRNY